MILSECDFKDVSMPMKAPFSRDRLTVASAVLPILVASHGYMESKANLVETAIEYADEMITQLGGEV